MEKITKHQRYANIIQRACSLGFEPAEHQGFLGVVQDAEDFLIENTEHSLEYLPIDTSGRQQHVSFADGFGYTLESTGDHIIFQYNRRKRVVYYTVIDSFGNVIDLFDYAGPQHVKYCIQKDAWYWNAWAGDWVDFNNATFFQTLEEAEEELLKCGEGIINHVNAEE